MKQKPTRSIEPTSPKQALSHQSVNRKLAVIPSFSPVKAECKDLYGAESLMFYFYYAQLFSAAKDKAMVFLNEAV
ncbi:hypothetical protein HRG84_11920 [Flavisolibacter sp. BT320]|nr:hypothetical protein [Flavisolibacter longurius]